MGYTVFVYGTLRPDLLLEKNPPGLAHTFRECEYKQAWIQVEGKLVTTNALRYPFLVDDDKINVIPGNLIEMPEIPSYQSVYHMVNTLEVYAGYYLVPVIAYTSEKGDIVPHYTYTYWSDVELKNPIVIKDYKEYLYGKSVTQTNI